MELEVSRQYEYQRADSGTIIKSPTEVIHYDDALLPCGLKLDVAASYLYLYTEEAGGLNAACGTARFRYGVSEPRTHGEEFPFWGLGVGLCLPFSSRSGTTVDPGLLAEFQVQFAYFETRLWWTRLAYENSGVSGKIDLVGAALLLRYAF